MTSQSDGQAQGKDIVTDLSPDEKKVRDIRPKIKILPQLDGPTDPSSDEEWIERGKSPITKGKNKRKTERRKFTKSPNLTDLQDDINSSENGNGEISTIELEGMFSSSLDEENIADISTEKKITQDVGNAKRRKTGKTHETIEIDRDYQKIDKPAEKPRKKSKKEDVPKPTQSEQEIYNRTMPPPIISEGKTIIDEETYSQLKKCCAKKLGFFPISPIAGTGHLPLPYQELDLPSLDPEADPTSPSREPDSLLSSALPGWLSSAC
ncbi:hypothetical protein JTB14_031755 [Gonioctena quinquepunctata]|nr:hypothetical protein JTB14_031755 [Gonioctena quinquepunctata]